MDFRQLIISVIALTAVSVLPPVSLSSPVSRQPLLTGNRTSSPGVDVVQTVNITEPMNQTIYKNIFSRVDISPDEVPSMYTKHETDNVLHDLIQKLNLNELIQQLLKLFDLSRTHLGPLSRRLKQSGGEGNNLSQKPIGFIAGRVLRNIEKKYLWQSNSRIKRSGDIVKYLWEKHNMYNYTVMKQRDKMLKYLLQKPSTFNSSRGKRSDANVNSPLQKLFMLNNPILLADALYQYAVQTVSLPASLEELDKLSNDQIRALSYKQLSIMERTFILLTSMWEGAMFAVADEQRQARVESFWTWFRWFYPPDIIINILLGITADTGWHSIIDFYEAFNTNPGGDLRDIVKSIRIAAKLLL